MLQIIQKMLIRDLMNDNPLMLKASVGLHRALGLLLDHHIVAAPVVTEDHQLIGFVSEQDILRELWANDFSFDINHCVGDIMRDSVVTVSPDETVDELAAYMVFDPNKLFENKQTNQNRIPGSFNDDLENAQVCRPKLYPVVQNGIVLGTIDRQTILHTFHRLAQNQRQQTGESI
ncbi:CBS domain-containing protein [Celerinatantimonas yamalensis]|uniref:CBS domain-containing protein n=1 Tax=Celerinatantimonas yamalensis TaxID=559956 RepID=A0ABW9G3E5_9GAMM